MISDYCAASWMLNLMNGLQNMSEIVFELETKSINCAKYLHSTLTKTCPDNFNDAGFDANWRQTLPAFRRPGKHDVIQTGGSLCSLRTHRKVTPVFCYQM